MDPYEENRKEKFNYGTTPLSCGVQRRKLLEVVVANTGQPNVVVVDFLRRNHPCPDYSVNHSPQKHNRTDEEQIHVFGHSSEIKAGLRHEHEKTSNDDVSLS